MLVAGMDRQIKEISEGMLNYRLDTGHIIGQITLSHSEKLLFAGIGEDGIPGAIRSYKFPLSGEYFELQAHAS